MIARMELGGLKGKRRAGSLIWFYYKKPKSIIVGLTR